MQEICLKIGIMGGTFDPVHHGHLIIAETVREQFSLEKVIFIPSGQPPHKDYKGVTSAEQRYRMLERALVSNPYFDLSRVEIERNGYTYSIDTLTQLKVTYGNDAGLFFIVGADVIPELITWREFQKVFTMCEFIAVFRPGSDKSLFSKEIDRLKSEYMAKIHVVEVPLIEISSSDIRKRVAEGKSIKYLVPDSVEVYIKENQLFLPE